MVALLYLLFKDLGLLERKLSLAIFNKLLGLNLQVTRIYTHLCYDFNFIKLLYNLTSVVNILH